MKVRMTVLLAGLTLVLFPDGSTASQTPHDCQREVILPSESIETQFRLHCNLRYASETEMSASNSNNQFVICRTINSEYDQTNFSVIPASGTVALSITCAELVGHVSRLDDRSLAHLASLEDLEISHCKLTSLPAASLTGLARLANLSIHTHPDPESDLSLEIEAGALSGLRHLTRLDLSYSGLWRIPERELCGLNSLTYLNVSHNSIKEVKDIGLFPGEEDCRLVTRPLNHSSCGLSEA